MLRSFVARVIMLLYVVNVQYSVFRHDTIDTVVPRLALSVAQ